MEDDTGNLLSAAQQRCICAICMDDTHIIYFDRRITFMFTQKNLKALTDALLAGSQGTGPP